MCGVQSYIYWGLCFYACASTMAQIAKSVLPKWFIRMGKQPFLSFIMSWKKHSEWKKTSQI